MMLKNTYDSYGLVARFFHWAVFILVIGAIYVGLSLDDMPRGEEKREFIQLHKSVGVLLIMLVLARLIWSWVNESPRFLGTNSNQRQAARIMHFFLYVLLLAQPITGLLMVQSKGYSVGFFGLFDIPALVSKNEELAEIFDKMHEILWLLLVIAVALHAAAALYHHFIVKDDTLKRMTKG